MATDHRHVEAATADLFPRIHLTTSRDDLERHKQNLLALFRRYAEGFGQREGEIVADRAVLEVGCGGRASGIYALEHYRPRTIEAVDLSEQNVAHTRALCARFGFTNVTVRQGNALRLPFADASFDFAFSDGVIHHATDTYACFREMVRVLRPGGHLFVAVYGYGGLWGRVVHPAGRLVGKIVPLRWAERFVNATGVMQSQENSLLDWFYTPIQNTYRTPDVLAWYAQNGFEQVTSLRSTKWFYNLGPLTPLLFGHGYIYAIGRKPPPVPRARPADVV